METNNDKLLPCPFCGSSDIDSEGWKNSEGVTGPACNDCNASSGSVFGTAGTNIKTWNTRASTLKAAEPEGDCFRIKEMTTDFAKYLADVMHAHRGYGEYQKGVRDMGDIIGEWIINNLDKYSLPPPPQPSNAGEE